MSGGVRAGYLSPPLPRPCSRSSILCGCLCCLRLPREAGWPRRLMTAGLAGRTHPSAEGSALPFNLSTLLLSLCACISFYFLVSVGLVMRRCLILGTEKKRERRKMRKKQQWWVRKKAGVKGEGRGRDMHQTRTTACFIQAIY